MIENMFDSSFDR